MDVIISNADGRPIYEQIFEQIRGQIISGKIPADTPLPSIRSLAKDLRISVITTKRAYDELEREGYIYTLPQKGSFAASLDLELLKEEHLREMEEHLRRVKELAALAGISKEDVFSAYQIIEEE